MKLYHQLLSAITGSIIALTAIASLPANAELGDFNGDASINASDAASILITAAQRGAFPDYSVSNEDLLIADVNHDGDINASDAALVLQYAAYRGAAGTVALSLQPYLYEADHTVMRIAVWPHSLGSADRNIEIIDSAEALQSLFTEKEKPHSINSLVWLSPMLENDKVCADICEAFPETFFENRHLVAIIAKQDDYGNILEIRNISNEKDTVTISMHTLNYNGSPLDEMWVILIKVDASVTSPEQVILNETKENWNW